MPNFGGGVGGRRARFATRAMLSRRSCGDSVSPNPCQDRKPSTLIFLSRGACSQQAREARWRDKLKPLLELGIDPAHRADPTGRPLTWPSSSDPSNSAASSSFTSGFRRGTAAARKTPAAAWSLPRPPPPRRFGLEQQRGDPDRARLWRPAAIAACFSPPTSPPQVGTFALVSTNCRHVKVPVIAAGGIGDAPGQLRRQSRWALGGVRATASFALPPR